MFRQQVFSKKNGFTLVELMVVVGILLIFAAIAAPNLYTFIQSSQLMGVQNEFVASLSLARNEAAKRGVPVFVQATAPVTGSEFSGGWKVWADLNSNGILDTGEPIIRAHAALPNTVSFGDGTTTAIQFNSRGYLIASTMPLLRLCQGAGNTNGYQISIQNNGLSDVTNNVSCP